MDSEFHLQSEKGRKGENILLYWDLLSGSFFMTHQYSALMEYSCRKIVKIIFTAIFFIIVFFFMPPPFSMTSVLYVTQMVSV